MMMLRKFVSYDGEVLEETMWNLSPTHTCFYCGDSLIQADSICYDSQDFNHDFITLVDPKGVKSI